jgi:hypothetical protein
MRMVDGRFPLAEKPGLGFELAEASFAKYPFGGTRPTARVFNEDGSVAKWCVNPADRFVRIPGSVSQCPGSLWLPVCLATFIPVLSPEDRTALTTSIGVTQDAVTEISF